MSCICVHSLNLSVVAEDSQSSGMERLGSLEFCTEILQGALLHRCREALSHPKTSGRGHCGSEVCLYVCLSLCLALSLCVFVCLFLSVIRSALLVLSVCLADGTRRDETTGEETGAGRPCCLSVCASELQGRVEGSSSVSSTQKTVACSSSAKVTRLARCRGSGQCMRLVRWSGRYNAASTPRQRPGTMQRR
jgi:hypothetical protein